MMEENDAAFVAAFEAGRMPAGGFHHLDHIRLAWLVLRTHGAVQGESRIASGIRRFAASQGHAELYHDTLTRAWVKLVAAAMAAVDAEATFADLLRAQPQLADKAHVFRFYSPELLSSSLAREGWVGPDIASLPRPQQPRPQRRQGLLRLAFAAGALTDAVALLPLLLPPLASLLWGFEDGSAAYRFATGYAAALMLGWTVLLLWAYRRPLERAFVAPLTVIVIYGLIAAEVVAVVGGHVAAWRMLPTWGLQAVLLGVFAAAYHLPAPQAEG